MNAKKGEYSLTIIYMSQARPKRTLRQIFNLAARKPAILPSYFFGRFTDLFGHIDIRLEASNGKRHQYGYGISTRDLTAMYMNGLFRISLMLWPVLIANHLCPEMNNALTDIACTACLPTALLSGSTHGRIGKIQPYRNNPRSKLQEYEFILSGRQYYKILQTLKKGHRDQDSKKYSPIFNNCATFAHKLLVKNNLIPATKAIITTPSSLARRMARCHSPA